MCQTLREAKRMAHFSPVQQTVRGKATHPTYSVEQKWQPENASSTFQAALGLGEQGVWFAQH